MLVNNSNTFLHILVWISTTPEFNFELTGSRAFGNACRSSDYDFFVLQSEYLEERLLGLGFMHLKASDYQDRSITKVFRHGSEDGIIDIQVIDTEFIFEKKRKINNALKAYPDVTLVLHGNKSSLTARNFWNLLFDIA